MTFLPKKIYLNGSDAFHLILEKNRKLTGEGNNQLYFCVQLTSRHALEQIEENSGQSPLIDWIANIRLVNPQIGVPFYTYKHQGKKIEIHHHGTFNEQFPTELLNKPLSVRHHQFLRMESFRFEGNTYLLLTLHHVLFDGKGAGMLLQHLTGELPVTKENYRSFFPRRLKWKHPLHQWLNLIQVKQTVEKTNKGKTAYLFEKHPQQTGFEVYSHSFSERETNQIHQNATKNGARFGLNLFQVACISKTYSDLLTTTDALWIPIPYNGRKRGAGGTVISNYTSFIFHRLTVTSETTLSEITKQLQQQMNEQIKDELPEKYNRLLQLMRFFPVWFNHLVTTKSSKGNIASFLYSSTEMEAVSDMKLIEKQWILPPFSYPPGLTVNFYLYKRQLHFHIVYSRKVLDSKQITDFSKRLTDYLLNEP